MNGRALIALRGTPPAQVLRLARRKNLTHGCILARPFFFALAHPEAKRLYPVRSIWPAIAARVRPVNSFSPVSTGPIPTRQSKLYLQSLPFLTPKAILLTAFVAELLKN